MVRHEESGLRVDRRALLRIVPAALLAIATTSGCANLLKSGAGPTDPENLVEDGAPFNYDLLLVKELREADSDAAGLARTMLEARRKAAFLLGQGVLDAVKGARELVGGFTALRASPHIGDVGLDTKGFGVLKNHPTNIKYDGPEVENWWTTVVDLVPKAGSSQLQLDMVTGIAQKGRRPEEIRDVSGSMITLGRSNTDQGEYWSLTAQPASSDVPTGWPTSQLAQPVHTIGQLERVAAMDTVMLGLLFTNAPMFQ